MQRLILSFNNRAEVYEHPVPLQDWDLATAQNSHVFSTIKIGEVLAIGGKKLKSTTIDSFFPSKHYPFLFSKSVENPWAVIQQIERWKESKRPIRVIIPETSVNLAMMIETFKVGRAEGDGSGDVSFSLELLEYSFLNTPRSRRESKKGKDNKLKERPDEKTKEEVRKHKVKKGDTMWDMAEKYLGNGSRWKEIAKLNKIKNGWDLKAGQELKIPPKNPKQKAKTKKGKK